MFWRHVARAAATDLDQSWRLTKLRPPDQRIGVDIVADFVVWYRKVVPDGEQVVFCDDSYSFDGVIPPGATKEDVVAVAEQPS